MEIGVLLKCPFAFRVARHDKGTPPKIAGVKCLFFLLAKKMPKAHLMPVRFAAGVAKPIDRSIPIAVQ